MSESGNGNSPLVGEQIVNAGGVGIEHHEHHHHARLPAKPVLPWQELPPRNAPDLFQLLVWRTRLAPLVGRDAERADLLAWAQSGASVAVRFLTGEGGAGKTRLAAEVAADLKDMGWEAGFIDLEHDARALIEQGRKPLLLLVDYPEQNRVRVQELLKELVGVGSRSNRVRLLLLSRQSMGQWEDLVTDSGAESICDSQGFAVRSLQTEDAIQLCREVWPRLQEKYGFAVPSVEEAVIATWLEENPSLHRRPLLVLAAALHTAVESKRTFSPGGKAVQALVRWELKRLRLFGKGGGFQESAVSRLAALAATGGLTASTLRRLAEPQLEVGLPAPARIVDAVSKLPWWRADAGFAAPGPDIMAAALLQEVLSERADMASEWLWAVLQDQAETDEQASELAIRLDRIGYDIRTVLGPPNHRMAEWLVRMVEGNVGRADRLKRLGYQKVHDGARQLSVSINRTRLQDTEVTNEERAGLLNNAGNVLADVGDRDGALKHIEESVRIHRELTESRPEAFRPDFAKSLSNLGSVLIDVGDRSGALKHIEEAVRIHRELAEARPEAFLPDLAKSLSNLGCCLIEVGDREDARKAIEESVRIHRELAEARPEAFRPDFATSLHNLGNILTGVGDHDGAHKAAEEAVRVHRELAESRPEAFRPDLAKNPNGLGIRLVEVGDWDGAHEAMEEAVTTYRELAASRPEAFRPNLAMSLNNLGNVLRMVWDWDGAYRATEEAVRIHRELAESRPEAFRPDLAKLLSSLGCCLIEVGDREGARKAIEEAVRIHRELAASWPEAFRPDLALNLNTFGSMLRALGDVEGALKATQESVSIRYQLAEASPQAFAEQLAMAADNLELLLKENNIPVESDPLLSKARALLSTIGHA